MKIFALTFALALLQPVLPPSVAPTLSDGDKAKLQVLELRVENINLKMTLLQAEGQKIQAEHATLITSLRKEGFMLQRGEDGVYRYVAVPPKPEGELKQ
jgi:hypothetical protein